MLVNDRVQDAISKVGQSYYDRRIALADLSVHGAIIEPGILNPNWLTDSGFYDSEWRFLAPGDSGNKITNISFSIFLSDGSLLTDEKNSKFLLFLKLFIAVQFHSRFTNGKVDRKSVV